MKRLNAALAATALLCLGSAHAQTLDNNPVDIFQNLINHTIVANGRQAITGTVLNAALNTEVPIWLSQGSWDTNGVFTPSIPFSGLVKGPAGAPGAAIAAVPNVDYLTPTGSGAGLTGVAKSGANSDITSLNALSAANGCAQITGGVLGSTGVACGSGGGGGTITFPATAAGTTNSGGIPYFSSGTALSSSAALPANAPVIGGGAGVAPSTGTRSGNTTIFATVVGTLTSGHCANFDANGNIADAGATCGSGAGNVAGSGTSVVGNLPSLNNTSTTAIVDSGLAASNVATLSTAQTVSGVKTFSSSLILSGLTGILKGNGSSVVGTATAGTDYLAPNGSGTGLSGVAKTANNLSDLANLTTARTNLTAAKSGANSDITSITGLTTALTVGQGGSGATTLTGILKGNGTSAFTAATAGTDYLTPTGSGSGLTGVAFSGANSNITSLSGLTTPLSVAQGGTSGTTAASARSGIGAAASGSNSDITGLSSLSISNGCATINSGVLGSTGTACGSGGGSGTVTTVRQTVQQAPQTSAGVPNFIVATSASLTPVFQNISSTSPLIISAAQGQQSSGGNNDIVHVDTSAPTSVACPSGTAGQICVIYENAGTGVIVTAVYAAALGANYPQCGGALTTSNGKYSFDYCGGGAGGTGANAGQPMVGYVGNGTSAVETPVVPLGECVYATTTTLSGCVAYSLNGYFDSGYTATFPGTGTAISYNSNLGVNNPIGTLFVMFTTAQANWNVGDVAIPYTNVAAATPGPFNLWSNGNQSGFTTGGTTALVMENKSSGVNTVITNANVSYKMIWRRPWGGS